jgi:hypothetical protein
MFRIPILKSLHLDASFRSVPLPLPKHTTRTAVCAVVSRVDHHSPRRRRSFVRGRPRRRRALGTVRDARAIQQPRNARARPTGAGAYTVLTDYQHRGSIVSFRTVIVIMNCRHRFCTCRASFSITGLLRFLYFILSAIQVDASDSPLFHHLTNEWRLEAIPAPSSASASAPASTSASASASCHLHFSVDFAFRSAAHAHLADLFFDAVVQRLVDAFETRCAHAFGRRAPSRRIATRQ